MVNKEKEHNYDYTGKIKYGIVKRHSVMDVSYIIDKSGKKRRKFYVY